MKNSILLVTSAFLSVGTIFLLNAQDDKPDFDYANAPELKVEPAKQESGKDQDPAKPLGIKTNEIVSKKMEKDGEEVPVAPLGSVFSESGKYFVLAKGAESDIDFQQREVTLGKTDGVVVEITDGLFPGDEVVTVTVNQLKFPAFDHAEVVGACNTGACPTGPQHSGADCSVDGSCDFTFSADEFFANEFEGAYAPGPVYDMGPGAFCPPY